MNCKNCGHPIHGNYCSQCGQKSSTGRIDLPYFLSEILGSIFQLNRGFFFTLKELFVRPGKSVRDFIEGKRVRYFKPIPYVLTLSTLYFLVTLISDQNTWLDDFVSGFMQGAVELNKDSEIPTILVWSSKNFAYTTLLLLPVFSLASYWSFYKFGNNYLEHLVINSYITGQQAVLYAFSALIASMGLGITFLESVPFLLSISYTCWFFWQFYAEGNRVGNLLRTGLTYLLYLVFSMVILISLIALLGLG